jgi:hypothetical protein
LAPAGTWYSTATVGTAGKYADNKAFIFSGLVLLSHPSVSQQRKRLVEYCIIHKLASGQGSYFTGKLYG